MPSKPKPMPGAELARARELLRMTQQQFAEEIPTSKRSVENYEQGARPVPEWLKGLVLQLLKRRRIDFSIRY